MKILWLSHLVPYPPKSGVLQRSYNLVREISKYHEVTLVAFNQSALMSTMFSSNIEGLIEAKEQLSMFCKRVEIQKIPSESTKKGKHILAFMSLFTATPYTINWLKSKKMSMLLGEIIMENEFDLIHFDTISLASYASLFPTHKKVLDHHNIESHMMLRRAEQENNIFKKLYFYQEGKKLLNYEKKICGQFDLHVTCSELDSQRLKKIVPGLLIDEIPNGVDVEYFYPQHENELKNQLVFAGGLNWYPNKDAMLFLSKKVWPILKEKVPNLIMNVVGKSPSSDLLELSRQDKQFKVHGFVDDVRKFISQSSVYVCPISDGGGTKLKILDAFAMGKAVVAHPVACEGIEVTENKNVLFAETAEEFADKIQCLLDNDKLRIMLGKNARELVVGSYSFQEIGQKLSLDYEKLQKL